MQVIGASKLPAVGAQASRVLIVDDSADLRELLIEWLELQGFDAVAACDGAEALRLLRGGLRPEAILLDRNIPVLDGPGLLREAADLLDGVAVVWMTGEDNEVRHSAVVATLRKPFDIDDVVRTLRLYCPRH